MIRPIPRYNPARENLSYPKYGEFGYEEPVGKKHLNNKTSAIHKLIFNGEAQPITRDAYNQVKMNYNGSFLQYAQQNSSQNSNSPKREEKSRVLYQSERDSPKQYYQQNHQIRNESPDKDRDYMYNIVQSQYSQRYSPSSSRVYSKGDSLDSILNPYKNQNLKRQVSLQAGNIYQNKSKQEYLNKSIDLSQSINRELSQKYAVQSIQQHRTRNPTFLNSLL